MLKGNLAPDGAVLKHTAASPHLLVHSGKAVVFENREDLAAIDFQVLSDPALVADIVGANEVQPRRLSQREFEALMEFLHALTDPRALDLRSDTPMAVPSGLPLAE